MSFGAFERLEDLARCAAPPIQPTADGLTLCVHFWNRAIRRPVNSEATQP
jgi:hypothetical protein